MSATLCLGSNTDQCLVIQPATNVTPITINPSQLQQDPLEILNAADSANGELPFYIEVTDDTETTQSEIVTLPVTVLNPSIRRLDKTKDDTLSSFATSIAMNANGNTLAISSPHLGHDKNDPTSSFKSIVEIYQYDAGSWAPNHSLEIIGISSKFGVDLAFNADGTRLAIGNADGHGDVRVYTLNNGVWSDSLLDPGISTQDLSGHIIAISGEGNTITSVVKLSTGVNQVLTYQFNGSAWVQDLTASNISSVGKEISLNEDGTVLAVSYSTATAAQVYRYSSGNWIADPAIGVSGTEVALDAQGNTLAIGHSTGTSVFKYADGA